MRCVCLALAAHAAAAFDLMSAVLKSPIYKNLLVPASRNMMINTAKENGVPWADAVAWIRGATTWELDEDVDVAVPAYYRQPFHAYEPGNLCWEAAWEAEVAGRAVGARNYPAFGAEGEEAFRGAFDDALVAAGARAPGAGDTILDLGCATGHGTRRLAAKFPDAASLVGVDLSPHMLAVARRLPQLCKGEDAAWINVVSDDARVSYVRADAASLPFADASQNFVVLSFVAHELPPAATRDVVEAKREALERTLLITHSNQALNDVFEKLLVRDIDELAYGKNGKYRNASAKMEKEVENLEKKRQHAIDVANKLEKAASGTPQQAELRAGPFTFRFSERSSSIEEL